MSQKIFIANDHAAVELKLFIIESFPDSEWIDLGAAEGEKVDYPDRAIDLSNKVLETPDSIGILICGSGQGMAMTANKFKNIRAALCWNAEVAKLSREHNNANVLCLGSRVTSSPVVKEIVQTFLTTAFEGGRHERRLNKMEKAGI